MKAKLFVLSALILTISSCSTVSNIKTNDTEIATLGKTNAALVEVYSTKDAAKKSYKIIGQVVSCADAGEDANKAVDLLKKEASYLGADAIVDLRLSISMGYWTNGIKATGTAVKYN